jgi:hypothetical protein
VKERELASYTLSKNKSSRHVAALEAELGVAVVLVGSTSSSTTECGLILF